jgi:hypothetical protein
MSDNPTPPADVEQPEMFNRFQMRWLKKEMEALHKRIDEMLARHKAADEAPPAEPPAAA